RAKLVEELVEDWQIRHREAMIARDLEELVQESVELGKLLNRGWSVLINRLFDEDVDDIDAAGKTMHLAVDVTQEVFKQIQARIQVANRKQYDIQGAEEFSKALESTRELKAEVSKKWPYVNHRMIRDSMAGYNGGVQTS